MHPTHPQSYDYNQRVGVHKIGWESFSSACDLLVEGLAAEEIEMVIGIARGGLFPATVVASCLRCEMFPTRVSRRIGDRVVHKKPMWKMAIPKEVGGKIVAVIDEIADSGETLSLVTREVLEKGAKKVITASLVAHSWANPLPDYTSLISDALILFPWDRKVFTEGEWQLHPEIVEALKTQGLSPNDAEISISGDRQLS
jgi:hypoxanthine phosphoribosyltransferase